MAALAVGILGTAMVSSSSVVSGVSTSLLVGTITTTTSSIGNAIAYLTSSSQPGIGDIISVLTNIDLEFTIKIIQQLVKEQEAHQLNDSIKQALIGVHEILEKINRELDGVKQAIEYHNTKYLNGWRSFAWNGNINILKDHSVILKHRYSLLFELLKIYNQQKHTKE